MKQVLCIHNLNVVYSVLLYIIEAWKFTDTLFDVCKLKNKWADQVTIESILQCNRYRKYNKPQHAIPNNSRQNIGQKKCRKKENLKIWGLEKSQQLFQAAINEAKIIGYASKRDSQRPLTVTTQELKESKEKKMKTKID